jgi:hypothetical protein
VEKDPDVALKAPEMSADICAEDDTIPEGIELIPEYVI